MSDSVAVGTTPRQVRASTVAERPDTTLGPDQKVSGLQDLQDLQDLQTGAERAGARALNDSTPGGA